MYYADQAPMRVRPMTGPGNTSIILVTIIKKDQLVAHLATANWSIWEQYFIFVKS